LGRSCPKKFANARKRFDDVIDKIVAQKTKACFICSLKPTYDGTTTDLRERIKKTEAEIRGALERANSSGTQPEERFAVAAENTVCK